MQNKIMSLSFLFKGSLAGVIAEEVSGSCLRQVGACSTCGRTIDRWQYNNLCARVNYPEKKWPDLLHARQSPALVSDRVLYDLKEANITGFKTYFVKLADIPLNKTPPFNYWILEPICDVEYDVCISKNDDINKTFCSTYQSWEIPKSYSLDYPYPTFHPMIQAAYYFWNAKTMNVYRRACSVEIIQLAIKKNGRDANFKT